MLKSFTKDDIISPLAHKKTVKEYTEKMKCIEEETINVNIKLIKMSKLKVDNFYQFFVYLIYLYHLIIEKELI